MAKREKTPKTSNHFHVMWIFSPSRLYFQRIVFHSTIIYLRQLLFSHRAWGTFPVSRETEPYEGARERSSFILLMKRFYADLTCPLARLLTPAEGRAQKRENLLLNWFNGSQSRHVVNWLHTDLEAQSVSRKIIYWLAFHINLPYWAIGWQTEVHNRVHHSCHSQAQ
jgi:hypothetical protein